MRPLSPTPSGLRVLVVDDYPDAAQSLHLLLRSWGHDSRVAADGPSALKTADAFLPHVALLDIGLPGVDGWQVGAELRKLPGCAGTLLIAVTGRAEEEDAGRSLRQGFHAHLVKPVNLADLEAMLGRLRDQLTAGGGA